MHKIPKLFCVLMILIFVISLTACQKQEDPIGVTVYYDDLGYYKTDAGSYILCDVSKYTEKTLVIPQYLSNGAKVDSVSCNGSETIETVVVPDGIEGFGWSGALKNLKIGADVENLSDVTANRFTVSESIEISESNPYVYSKNNCVIEKETQKLLFACELKEVVIPDGVRIIGLRAFDNKPVEKIVIPNSVTVIESGAFSFCRSLERIYIGENVTTIMSGAFWGTPDLIIDCAAETQPEGWEYGWAELAFLEKRGCKELNWGVERE